MENQITSNENAMRLFFTEDVFLVNDNDVLVESNLLEDPDSLQLPTTINETTNADNLTQEQPKPETEKSVVEQAPSQVKTIKHLGGNQKSVLILVFDEDNEVSTEQGRVLLRKIVKAIDLFTPDFALVNYANYKETDFATLHNVFNPKLLLAFGVGTADLKLDLNWTNEIILHNTTRMIFAQNLHQLEEDLPAKKLLWTNLQKL